MKKYLSIAACSMLVLASCSNEELPLQAGQGEEVVASFAIELPAAPGNRAENLEIGKGLKINQIRYNVYRGGEFLFTETVPATFDRTYNGLRMQPLEMTLVTGETYDIVFWADNTAGGYTLDNDGNITVSYEDQYRKTNLEERDAFFKHETVTIVKGEVRRVTLTRPFAQINVACTPEDTQAAARAGITVSKTALDVTGNAYRTLNLLSGEVSNAVSISELMQYALDNKPADQLKVELNGTDTYFDYLASLYVLAGTDQELLDKVDFSFDNNPNKRSFTSVPIVRNYRTNILGRILTDATDFEIILDPAFSQPDIIYGKVDYNGEKFDVDASPWDGSLKPYQVHSDGTIIIGSAAELAYLGAEATSTTSVGACTTKNVVLITDIDLNNRSWTPIGTNGDDTNHMFKGDFDGNGHTIKNLYVKQGAAYHAAGLFGATQGKIHDFTIDGAYVENLSSGDATTNGTGIVAGSAAYRGDGYFKNITVKNATLKGNRYVGTICGYVSLPILDCTVEEVIIEAAPDNISGSYDNGDKVGGIAGFYNEKQNDPEVKGNTVKNVQITAVRDCGGLVGATYGSLVKNNTVDGLIIIHDNSLIPSETRTRMDAFVGYLLDSSVVDNTNTATGVDIRL